MDADLRHLLLLEDLQQSIEVVEHAVHSRIRDDSHQMEAGSFGFHPLHRRRKHRVRLYLAQPERLVDSDQLLVHNPPRPDVLVTHFAVAHDAFRQTDILSRGRQLRHWIGGAQMVVARCAGEFHRVEGIVGGIMVRTPPVTNDQNNWFTGRHVQYGKFVDTVSKVGAGSQPSRQPP